MMREDFAEYIWYEACIKNSYHVDLQDHAERRKNNNQLVRGFLSNWDYDAYSKIKNDIKVLETKNSGLKKNKEILRGYNLKLIKLEKIQFVLNLFLIQIDPLNGSIFKIYESERRKEKEMKKDEKERTFITDIVYNPESFRNYKISNNRTVLVYDAFPPAIFEKILLINGITKIPLEANKNASTIKRTTDWLRMLIFEGYYKEQEEEMFYYWIIDNTFKISLAINISTSFKNLFDLIKNDTLLNNDKKDELKDLLIDNEDFILKQLSKFVQSPFKRINMYWINYEVSKLFQDLKNTLLNEIPQKKEFSDIAYNLFLNWEKEIDKRIKLIHKDYRNLESKAKKIHFCTRKLVYEIYCQFNSVYNSIVNSHINGNKIINSRDVSENIDNFIMEVRNELNLTGISNNSQLTQSLNDLKSKIRQNVDFTKTEHRITKKLINIFDKNLKECYSILFNMYSMECSAKLKQIKDMQTVDEADLPLKEIVEKNWGISSANEKYLEEIDVKIFSYIYNIIIDNYLFGLSIPDQPSDAKQYQRYQYKCWHRPPIKCRSKCQYRHRCKYRYWHKCPANRLKLSRRH